MGVIYHLAGYCKTELVYVDWDAAVASLRNMFTATDADPWDLNALVKFAGLSARRVRGERGELYLAEYGLPLSMYLARRRERAELYEMNPDVGVLSGKLARSAVAFDNEVL